MQPSGSSDAYCDGIADGIIDPDCAEGYDPDYVAEGEEGGGLGIGAGRGIGIGAVIAILLLVAGGIWIGRRSRTQQQ